MKEFDDFIEAVRVERRLDPRSSILDVRIEKRGSRLTVVGITTVADAVGDLIERLTAIKNRRYIKDEVVRLPDASVAGYSHAVVCAAVAPIYGDPALPAPQITQAVLGAHLELLARAGAWCRVRLEDGYLGWVHSGYLQFGTGDWAQEWERGTRGEPVVSLGSELLDDADRVFARLPWGARAIRLSQEQYELPDGRRGSMAGGEVVAVDRLTDRFPARGDSVTRTARRWVGAPYLWGGITQSGVDCSGLVQAVYLVHGVALPRDSDQQSRVGHDIEAGAAFELLAPGDLVFFSETTTRVSHVAISLGGSHIIHAALTNGGVEVNDLNGERDLETRLRSVITAARRVLPD